MTAKNGVFAWILLPFLWSFFLCGLSIVRSLPCCGFLLLWSSLFVALSLFLVPPFVMSFFVLCVILCSPNLLYEWKGKCPSIGQNPRKGRDQGKRWTHEKGGIRKGRSIRKRSEPEKGGAQKREKTRKWRYQKRENPRKERQKKRKMYKSLRPKKTEGTMKVDP